jgi:hypothetical protein
MITMPSETAPPDIEGPAPQQPPPVGQGKRPEVGQFRLQVDRQTKASYLTHEAAVSAGLIIKQAHPIVMVGVYDVAECKNTIIDLPGN